jgi:anthranilate phosphoribosyltransferase
MFVAAAAGARVAKHGGRSVSSQSGSADVLEALGVNINLSPEQVGRSIDEVGIGFMFAPNHHSAMKHAAPVRRELGVRTLFNILGPLTNPASAAKQVLGVFHPDLVGIQVRVLQRLGSTHALSVFGREGLDEISISGETLVGELKDGRVEEYTVHPEQFNLPVHDPRVLRVANVEESKAMLLAALENRSGAARDIVALNAGASIYVSGLAATLADGVDQAFEASPRARRAPGSTISLRILDAFRPDRRHGHGERAMSDILKRILAVKRDEVAAAQAALPLAEVRAMAERQPAARDFLGALRDRIAAGRRR